MASDLKPSAPSQPPTLVLRAREAAKLLKICERTLWEWTKRGEIPHIRLGRPVLYPVHLLQRWLEERAAKQAGPGDARPEGGADEPR